MPPLMMIHEMGCNPFANLSPQKMKQIKNEKSLTLLLLAQRFACL